MASRKSRWCYSIPRDAVGTRSERAITLLTREQPHPDPISANKWIAFMGLGDTRRCKSVIIKQLSADTSDERTYAAGRGVEDTIPDASFDAGSVTPSSVHIMPRGRVILCKRSAVLLNYAIRSALCAASGSRSITRK